MEKITVFLFLFIILFLFYSYFSFKKNEIKKQKIERQDIKKGVEIKENEKYEDHIIAAVIASLMDGKKYKIRNIFKEKEKKEEKSAWKIAGRNYNMQRRERI
jgi:hypothetical protein